MRVSAEDGPLVSPGLHTVLGVVASSASSLDVLTICLGARRLGGPWRSTAKHAMAEQYSYLLPGTACGHVLAQSLTRWRLVRLVTSLLP